MSKFVTIIFLLCWGVKSLAADFVVIVNKDNPATGISKENLRRMYTGRMQEYENVKIVAINQPPDSPVGSAFLADIVNKTPEAYKEYWVAQQVKGLGAAPMIQKTNEAVIALVSQIPGAVGYVAPAAVTDAVRIVPVK